MSTAISLEKLSYSRLSEPILSPSVGATWIKMLKLFGMLAFCVLAMTVVLIGIDAKVQDWDRYAAFRSNSIDGDNAFGGQHNEVDDNGPPPYTEYAKMARYLVHRAEWVSMGSLSTVDAIKGYPMVNIIAVADSARGAKSTGTLFFYLTMLDFTAQDLSKDNRLTVLLSMDQDLDCSQRGVDPMEPTCARIMISGRALKLDENTEEGRFGKEAMLSRHPAAKHWLETHNFFLCKLDILQIFVLDYYGGPHNVTVEEYMNTDPDIRSVAIPATNEPQSKTYKHTDDERTITIKIKKDSSIRHINLEV